LHLNRARQSFILNLKNLKKLGEMQEIGLQLKKQREAKGLGLADIEKTTKISIRLLRSIEAGDFGALPSGVFARNFVRQYCKAVGLSPEPILEKVFVVEPDLVESEDGPEEKSHVRTIVFVFVIVLLSAAIFWRYQGGGWRNLLSTGAKHDEPAISSTSPMTEASSKSAKDEKNTMNLKEEPDSKELSAKKTLTQSTTALDGKARTEDSDQNRIGVSELGNSSIKDSATPVDNKSTDFPVRFEADEKCWIHLRCPDKEMDFILMKGELYTTVCSDPAIISVGNAEHIRVFVDNQKVVFPAGQRVVKDFVLTKKRSEQ